VAEWCILSSSFALANRSPSDLPAATRQCLPQDGWFRLWGVIRTARQSQVNTVPLPGSLDTVTSHGGDPTPAPLSTGVGLATSSKFFMQRTATPLTCSPSIYLPHSTNFFLDHAQVDPESLQIDLEWACNLEQSHGRFNFDDSFLIVDQSGSICALSEFTFELS
jgi:hypothetical protein